MHPSNAKPTILHFVLIYSNFPQTLALQVPIEQQSRVRRRMYKSLLQVGAPCTRRGCHITTAPTACSSAKTEAQNIHFTATFFSPLCTALSIGAIPKKRFQNMQNKYYHPRLHIHTLLPGQHILCKCVCVLQHPIALPPHEWQQPASAHSFVRSFVRAALRETGVMQRPCKEECMFAALPCIPPRLLPIPVRYDLLLRSRSVLFSVPPAAPVCPPVP